MMNTGNDRRGRPVVAWDDGRRVADGDIVAIDREGRAL